MPRAAEARNDDVERRRLFDASPLRTLRVPEHLNAELAVHVLTLIYVGEQLNVAGTYFFARSQAHDATTDLEIADWLFMVDLSAYVFAVNAETWRRFCSGLGINSWALTTANHPSWFLRLCEERMPVNALSADALQARWRRWAVMLRGWSRPTPCWHDCAQHPKTYSSLTPAVRAPFHCRLQFLDLSGDLARLDGVTGLVR